MGMFIRRCRVEYSSLPFDRLADIREAFHQYILGQSGDSQFLNQEQSTWVSVYNIKEFLKSQAEKIERTGTSNIHPTVLHNYLADMSIQVPNISNIRQVRYLNYIRTKEYIQSLSNLHIFFDYSLSEGVAVQYALLNIGILEYRFGHLYNALSALNDALSAARFNKDEYCLQEVQYWIEICRKNQSISDNSSYSDNYLNNMETLTRARNMLREGDSSRHVFEGLYKSLINIKLKDIKNMDRVQYLITSLAWQRYGNSTMAESYQKLAEDVEDETVQDIEKTVISHANMLQSMGNSNRALEVLESFQKKYPTESDFLMDWKQAQARIKRQSNKKRKTDMMTNQADMLQYAIPPYSEEFFNAVHDNAEQLMLKTEYEKALAVLDEVHDFIRKTDQTAQLGYNLILQAIIYLQTNDIEASIPILIEAMSLSKRSNDAKNYYRATIKLSEAYVRTKEPANIKKSIFLLETIFPKVLLTKSKLLTSDLYLTYAEALDTSGMIFYFVPEIRKLMRIICIGNQHDDVLEYIVLAEDGYQEMGMKCQLLRALHFKTMLTIF
ncbi:hypothetical protein INT48_000274 [Thamnidium elegans]|uniref:Anaphase-promoting complex subunit 5 n=1 Tax=Thamnidium elegans TaxID=101142 RepID=A0A8H7VWL4_9FUNG|nr:hypothetical protein INT48_000274 [Thamnidium elegans]